MFPPSDSGISTENSIDVDNTSVAADIADALDDRQDNLSIGSKSAQGRASVVTRAARKSVGSAPSPGDFDLAEETVNKVKIMVPADSYDWLDLLRCPYENACSSSVIPVELEDPRIPPALNVLLLWLLRESLYLTLKKQCHQESFSGQYTDRNFNSLFDAEKEFTGYSSGILSMRHQVRDLLVSHFEKMQKQLDLNPEECYLEDIKMFWTDISEFFTIMFSGHDEYIQRLPIAMEELLELFLIPEYNKRAYNTQHLIDLDLKSLLAIPVYSLELRTLYYIASAYLQKTKENVEKDREFFNSLYLQIQKYNDFSVKDSWLTQCGLADRCITKVLLPLCNRVRSGAGVIERLTSFGRFFVASSAHLLSPEVSVYGNFGVMLEQFTTEMNQGRMIERFREVYPSAQVIRLS